MLGGRKGGCETIVVAKTAFRVVDMVVKEGSWAGTVGKMWLLIKVLVGTSRPAVVVGFIGGMGKRVILGGTM